MNEIKHIIVQAGGKGTRMEHLTKNKPKGLVSVRGEPMIIRLFRQYPKAKFYIISDYKNEVLEKYLNKFAKANYQIVKATGTGTCSGIGDSQKFIPKKTPFMVLWCDLYFNKPLNFKNMNLKKDNYIGLSKSFICRWSFNKNKLEEIVSDKCGIAGVYIFKNKDEIKDIPDSEEFCKYLREKQIKFKDFFLSQVNELGTLESYKKFVDSFPNSRPFNKIIFKDNTIIKKPIDNQGVELAKKEKAWYKWAAMYKWDFIPKIYKFSPIVMEKVVGSNLFKAQVSKTKKQEIIDRIIHDLKKIHKSEPSDASDHYKNDVEAILNKTKRRLDSICDLVPFSQDNHIIINNKKCINFYKKWDIVEKICNPFLTKQSYQPIHGDLTFSNILIDQKSNKTYFIDPRGYYGDSKIFGDVDYDWSKLYYSIVGNYDQFNAKNFELMINKTNIELKIVSSCWESFDKYFLKKINRDPQKILTYHAIIWLSLSSYAWDDYDSICGAFYNGIFLMQNIYEKTLK